MFELRSKMKWYLPPESDVTVQPLFPLEFPGPLTPPPPTPLEFQIPSVVEVWIFSGTTQFKLPLIEMTFGLVHGSCILPLKQAVKLTFFAPCKKANKSNNVIT